MEEDGFMELVRQRVHASSTRWRSRLQIQSGHETTRHKDLLPRRAADHNRSVSDISHLLAGEFHELRHRVAAIYVRVWK
jgi:hypothetical protein